MLYIFELSMSIITFLSNFTFATATSLRVEDQAFDCTPQLMPDQYKSKVLVDSATYQMPPMQSKVLGPVLGQALTSNPF